MILYCESDVFKYYFPICYVFWFIQAFCSIIKLFRMIFACSEIFKGISNRSRLLTALQKLSVTLEAAY